jgi:hypothetical protein
MMETWCVEGTMHGRERERARGVVDVEGEMQTLGVPMGWWGEGWQTS